jgi:glycosyltransferase involved in cell wall biosynthesis
VRCLVVMPLAEQRGGGELMLLHLIEHGRGLGIDWSVAFFSDGPMVAAVRGWGVDTHIVPAGRLRQPHRLMAAVWALRRLVKAIGADVVLSWMGKAQLYGGAAAALARVPAVWYQLGLPDPACWQDRLATRLPARVVLTCSATATVAQAKLKPHRPITTVYPGVDLSRFDPDRLPSPAECRRMLGLPTTGPLIGVVGRLQRWKGIHHLVDAMPDVLARHPDAHAVIVGGRHEFEPDYPAFLDARIAALGLADRVIRPGLQSNVPEWMQAMDVVIHASDAEPFGIVVIEAMALGKPTVATATAGPTEIITDGVDGLLWPPGDPHALAAALLRLLADPAAAATMATRGRRRAADFDVRRYARQMTDVVRRAAVDGFATSTPTMGSATVGANPLE